VGMEIEEAGLERCLDGGESAGEDTPSKPESSEEGQREGDDEEGEVTPPSPTPP
jgi:hypothetical protein